MCTCSLGAAELFRPCLLGCRRALPGYTCDGLQQQWATSGPRKSGCEVVPIWRHSSSHCVISSSKEFLLRTRTGISNSNNRHNYERIVGTRAQNGPFLYARQTKRRLLFTNFLVWQQGCTLVSYVVCFFAKGNLYGSDYFLTCSRLLVFW